MRSIERGLMIAASVVNVAVTTAHAGPSATYSIHGAREGDKPPVTRITLTELSRPQSGRVEWTMTADLAAGGTIAVYATTERLPMTSPLGPGRFTRYAFRDTRGKIVEYKHARTGQPVLPMFHFTDGFLPTCRPETPRRDRFAVTGEYLGHVAILDNVTRADAPPAPPPDLTLALDPDMLVGIVHCIKDDGSGQGPDEEYRYVKFTPADYAELIDAGCNLLRGLPAEDRPYVQDTPAFYFIAPNFPEDFYRANYAGIEMFVDEPAIRLGIQHDLVERLTQPAQVGDLLVTRFRALYGRDGVPYTLHNAVRAKHALGTLDLRVETIPAWETTYEAAFYELAGGAGGIVHEGRYELDTMGWHPDALFGPSTKIGAVRMLRCHYAVMRGAARAFDRDWGTSIYGQSQPALRELALTLAYNMGAKWFWFWTTDHEHHLPHVEKLRLMRALRDYAKANPRPDRVTLLHAADTAIALPWGYALAWDNLYTLGQLPLDRPNQRGVSYRDVIAAGAWQGVLCAQQGEEFDFTIEHPGLERLGYKRIYRVGEDAVVRVTSTESQPAASRPAPAPPLKIAVHVGAAENLAAAKPGPYVLPCTPCHVRPPTLDADFADWTGPWTALPSDRFPSSGTCDGPTDLAARVAFAYDDDNLYVAADVTDDVHSAPRRGWQIWDGDCVQIALDPLNARNNVDFLAGQQEFGLARHDDGTTATWRWFGPWRQPAGIVPDARIAIRRDDAARRTTYEAAVPLRELGPLLPAARRYVGVCVLVADADEVGRGPFGMNRTGFVETSPGALTDGKHPARFGSLEFLPPREPRTSETPASAAASIQPGNTTIPVGGELRWSLQLSSAESVDTPTEVTVSIETLTPASPAAAVASATFKCAGGAELRPIVAKLDVPPGRYRFTVSILAPDAKVLATTRCPVFVYPP